MRFSKYAFLAFALSFVAALFPQPVRAAPETIFIDDFTDTSKVDLEQTTAHVNTVQGWVELAQPPKSGVISVDPSADPAWPSNVIVADETGVGWYAFDQASRTLRRVDSLSAPYQNALAVSLIPETKNFWLLVRGTGQDDYMLKQAVFESAGMVDNPLVAVSGLTQVVAIAAVDSAAVAVADESGRVTVYSEGRVDAAHSFDTELHGIRSVINIPGTWNFIVVTGDGAHLFVYDQGAYRYVESAAHRIQVGGQEIFAGAQTEGGALVDLITPDGNLGYVYDQSAGRYVEAGVYTIGELKNPLAVALPSTQVVAVAEEEGRVRFFRYAGGSFAEDPGLAITGLSWTKDYRSPGIYVSKPIATATPNNMFRLVVEEENDPETQVRYELSVDGERTYVAIVPNGAFMPVDPAPGPYTVRATLESPSRSATPRILRVELQAFFDFDLYASIVPQEVSRGQKIMIYASLTEPDGRRIQADSISATLPNGGSIEMRWDSMLSRYTGEYLIPDGGAPGVWPGDGSYEIRVRATKYGITKEQALRVVIRGNIKEKLYIRQIQF